MDAEIPRGDRTIIHRGLTPNRYLLWYALLSRKFAFTTRDIRSKIHVRPCQDGAVFFIELTFHAIQPATSRKAVVVSRSAVSVCSQSNAGTRGCTSSGSRSACTSASRRAV